MKCGLTISKTCVVTAVMVVSSLAPLSVHAFVPHQQQPLHHSSQEWDTVRPASAVSFTVLQHDESDETEKNMARFRGYLNWIAKNTRGWRQAALQMDEELQAMEERWDRRDEQIKGRYHGSAIKPDQACYSVVAEAYAKASLGVEGAEKASAVLSRCQRSNDGVVGVMLYTTVMKAWANADEFVRARQLLSDMEQRYTESSDESMAPDMIAYTIYLNVLSDSKTKSGQEIATEALELLQEMHKNAESGANAKARPNTYAYTAAMKCLARAKDYVGIQALFEDLKKRTNEAPEDLKGSYLPGKLVYGTMIGIYAESDLGDEGALKADQLLQELQKLHNETGNILYRPNPFILASVLTAYSKVNSHRMLEIALMRTDEILEQCKQDDHLANDTAILEAAMKVNAHRLRRNGARDAEIILRRVPQPSANMFQIAIFAQSVRQNPIRAQKLLDEMTFLARERKLRYPSTSTIISCIKAWTKAGGDKALEQADRLVRRLVKLCVEGHQKSPFEIETRLFNDLIMGWRRTGLREAGEKSEDVLQLMYDAYETTGNVAFVPTNYTFHSIIEAWANSSHPDAGQRALGLLKRMETAPATATSKVDIPNTVLYAAMKSLVRSGNATLIGATNDLYSRMCENYLIGDRSFNLTPKTNTMFLRDFVSNPDTLAGVRAENLLRHMEEISMKQGLGHLRPSHFEYNCVMNVYAKKGQIEEAERLLSEMENRSAFNNVVFEVSATTYNVLILALAERAGRDDDERIEQLLNKVLDGHRQSITSLKPDDAFFTSFLFVLAQRQRKDPSLVNRGFHLLQEKRRAGLFPSDMDYGILCKLVLNHGSLDSIDRLIATLKEAECNSERGIERPLRRSVYVQAMTTCMYHPDTAAKRKAMDIMQHVENRVGSGLSQLTLDRHLYHVLLSGWARSYDRDAFREAVQLFEKMKSSENAEIQPIIRSYNWVIFAAGRTPTKTEEEARSKFETAMGVFTEAHQSDRIRPDALTYSNFLFVCANLLPKGEGRDKVARNVVDLCQKKGLMSRLVYENLSRYFPNVLQAVEQSEGVKSGVIPREWQRNVAGEGRRRDGKLRKSTPVL